MGIFVPDLPITAMDDEFGRLMLRDIAGLADGVALPLVD
jgi:hypothetical protein